MRSPLASAAIVALAIGVQAGCPATPDAPAGSAATSGSGAGGAATSVSGAGGLGGTTFAGAGAGGTGGGATFPDCASAAAARGSTGCDFWALKTDLIADGDGACFAAVVASAADGPVHLTVEHDGASLAVEKFTRVPSGEGKSIVYGPYDAAAGLGAGEVAVLFLGQDNSEPSQMPKCPVLAGIQTEVGVAGTGLGKAFHISTDQPAVVYQILPYGSGAAAATSATLLLPVSAWHTNYIAINAYAKSELLADAAPSLDILAREDGTQVLMLPKVAIAGGAGVPAGPAGQAWSATLDAGQYLQITQPAELTGSPIVASKPVAVWGGASCMNVPVSASACDSAQQQLAPVNALGSQYAAVRHKGRGGQEETSPWRLVGAVNGTVLSWTPSAPPGAPSSLALGEVAELAAPGPFVVSSQDADHPFYLSGYMTGGEAFAGEGDPEWVTVIPTAQYLPSYVFFTDPTYPETSLVVVRRPSQADGSFADVTLDCAGKLVGWEPLGAYELTRVDLVTGDFEPVGGCANGRHAISSELPFGLTVWGWGTAAAQYNGQPTWYVSYAYPAGMSVVPINDVIVPVPR